MDAALRGRVVLPDGEGASHARVLVRDAEGEVERTVAATPEGRFLLLRLPPGDYVVCAEAASFVATRHSGGGLRPVSCGTEPLSGVETVELAPGEIADVALALTVIPSHAASAGAPQAASIPAVSIPAASIPAARPPGAVEYTQAQMEMLPLQSREWEGAAELSSGANDAVAAGETAGAASEEQESEAGTADRQPSGSDGEAAGGLSYAGLSPVQNRATTDGLSSEQSFRSGPRGAAAGGPRMAASFGQGAVGSLRVMPRTFSAEYGGAAGGVVAVVSKRAPARVHGSAFVQSRESAWAAANPFSIVSSYHNGVITSGPVKPGDSEVQFGGTAGAALGGRWMPDRLRGRVAAFMSVEAQRRASTVVSTPAAAGFFALTPTQIALLGNRGVSAAATHAALNYLSGLTGSTQRDAWRTLGFGRVDAQVALRDRITLGYERNRLNSPAGAAVGQASEAVVARGLGSLGNSVVRIDALSGRWLHVFSPRWNNELRAQVARDLEFETPDAPLAQEPAIGPEGLAPEISIAPNGFAYGTTASLGRVAYPDESRLQLADTFELALGRNLLRAGADWSRVHDRIASLNNADGTFLYDSGETNGRAGGLVDWITDYTFNVHAYPNGACPSITAKVHDFCFRSYTQSFGDVDTSFATHDFAGFVEDSLGPRDKLQLTFGVRYDYTLLPPPQQPNSLLDAAFAGLASPQAGATASIPEDRNNFGPRVAIQWSPGGGGQRRAPAFTVQLGYGVFFGRIPGATVRAALADTALPATTTHIRITPTTETLCPQVSNQGFGYPCAYTAAPPAAVAQTTSATLLARSFRAPAVQRATLSVEREMGRRISLRAGYEMALATQLPGSTDLNIAPSTSIANFVIEGGDAYRGLHTGETFAVPLYTARRTTQFGPVTAVTSSANSTYHAGTLEAQWRTRGGFGLRGSYTYSRAIDYGAQPGATPRLDGQFDPFANGYDKGLSSLQFPQRFAGSLQWNPVLEEGPKTLRQVLSHWRFSAIGVAGSGAPYSYAVFGGTRLSGGHESLNGSGGATYLPTVGRNTLRLPPRGRADVRVSRAFAAGERMRVEGFAEAFNLLNSENLSRVQTRAFLLGTPANPGGPTPLTFQDAATVASEGLNTLPFGVPTSSTTGLSRERQLELGMRLTF